MNSDMRSPSAPRLFFGLGITLFGLVLLLDRLGISSAQALLHLWPVGLIAFGALVVLAGLRGGSSRFGQGRFGTGRPHRSFFGLAIWVLVLSALFSGSFRNLGGSTEREARARLDSDVVHADVVRTNNGGRADTRDNPQLFAVLSGDRRSNVSTRFRGADMTSVMGGTDLDLRHAQLAPGQEATIDVTAIMGGATIRVPDTWQIDVRVIPVMGGVQDQRWPRSAPDPGQVGALTEGPAPRLIIKGFVLMGGLIVKS
jgi:hypothetical protein